MFNKITRLFKNNGTEVFIFVVLGFFFGGLAMSAGWVPSSLTNLFAMILGKKPITKAAPVVAKAGLGGN